MLTIYGFFAGSLITLSVYHFFVFIGRKKDYSNLSYALYCLFLGLLYIIRRMYPLTVINYNLLLVNLSVPIICHFLSIFLVWFSDTIFNFKNKIIKYGLYIFFIALTIYILILIVLYIILKKHFYLLIYFPALGIYALLLILSIIFNFIKNRKNWDNKKYIASLSFIILMIYYTIYSFLTTKNIDIPIHISLLIILGHALVFAYALTDSFNKEHKELIKLSNTLEYQVKERTNELENANKQLKSLDKLKNDFIANITHDFRSPLTAILNTADLALINNDGKNEENYSIIYNASLRLKKTIDRLLDLAKMDSQGIRLKIKKIDPVLFLSKIVDFYSSSIIGSNIKINKNLPSNSIKNFYTDPEKLEEIINNIISNSIKFIDPKIGIIDVYLIEKNASLIIKIADNGIGIPSDALVKIFQRFEQVHEEKNARYRGTGIGLAYSKQLVEYLKGRIWAESEGKGKGAVFYIELKKGKHLYEKKDFYKDSITSKHYNESLKEDLSKIIHDDINNKLEKNQINKYIIDPNKKGEYDLKKGLILIIDDDKKVREIIMKYLLNGGYKNFIMAGDGKLGLDAVYQCKPDLIICDFNMPNLRGDDFHDEIITNPDLNKIPFIFLSAVVDKNLIFKRKKMGASAYLNKPIDGGNLLITVEYHIKKYFDYLKILHNASIDELTGLFNRRNIIQNLHHELSIRRYRNISLIFLDLDNYKNINDTYGHQFGDKIIKKTGKIIKNTLRNYDIPGRYGGDEFLIILPDTNLKEACFVAEKLRKQIENNIIKYNNKIVKYTSSIGVSSLIDNEKIICSKLNIKKLESIYNINNPKKIDWNKIEKQKIKAAEILLKIADEALYKAKYTIKCDKCGFKSNDKKIFKSDLCPNCGNNKLILRGNKVETL